MKKIIEGKEIEGKPIKEKEILSNKEQKVIEDIP